LLQACSSEINPARTAITIWALWRDVQRFIPGGGRSVILSGNPSGPVTYPIFERFSDGVGSLLYDGSAGIGVVAARVAPNGIHACHRCLQHTLLHTSSIKKTKEAESTIGQTW
jgi:hypothetical protein